MSTPSQSRKKKPTRSSSKKPAVQNSSSKRKKQKRRVNHQAVWTLILIFFIVIELVVGALGAVFLHRMSAGKPELVIDDFFSAESSHIYDRNGSLIADVGLQLRENVSYDEISESVVDAFLAVEDSRYFDHNGFDLPRFTKSAIDNVLNKIRGRSGLSGGSTFTMQLVKLTYFQNDETGQTANRNIEYKVQQIALARELEEVADKKTIFEMYLNKMNFGGTGNIRGIEMAAQYYYGKSAGELNLPEAAMLAGVINAPYTYDPHNFLDNAIARRNTVLSLMVRHGYITEKEYNLARMVKVEDTLIDPSSRQRSGEAYAYQSYIDTVIEEASAVTGLDPLSVAMDIYTFMDPEVQSVMDDIQAERTEEVVFPDELMEIGIIAENNQTGEIVAIGGGRNYGRGGSMLLNHATNQYKQPGSSVKPFLDYALAFEYLGWATSHVVTDRPISYQGTNMIIKNANGVYNGQVTLSYAISASLNTPAIQALQDVINTAGWDTVVSYINSLGFSQVTYDNFDIGFAIGGSNFTASCQEVMAAHAILMNGGNYIKPHTIERIEYRNGMSAPLTPYYEPVNVLSPQAAYLAAQLMYTAVHGGVFNYLDILTRSYATYGKTGTSDWGDEGLQYNIPQGASKDKWMVADTSEYTICTWVGYEKGVKDKDTYFSREKSNMNIPGNICSLVLDVLNRDHEPEALEMPEGISSITHVLGTWPYTSPVSGMDGSLITSGLIKSQYASLASPESADKVSSLNSFNASLNNDGTVHFSWTKYPDTDKLEVAENTMDISLRDGAGNILVEAYGNRMFDWSWVYGPIRYQARLYQNGVELDTISTDEDEWDEDIELKEDADIRACGFYAYEETGDASNEICVTFHTPKEEKEPEPTVSPSPSPEPEPEEPAAAPEEPEENSEESSETDDN
ncbi:MAG: penicillin-binding protein [Solobacterium sp.]|nr:penicillin-binding protein [Solobacterium sp.]